MMSNTISKIKINEKRVEIHYNRFHETRDGEIKNTSIPLKSEVMPHRDLFMAFQELKSHALFILELVQFDSVDEKTLSKHVVTTLNIIEDDEDTKLMISVNKYIKSGQCYSVTTPLISLEHQDYTKLDELNEAYTNLVSEARQYLRGKNGEDQMEINFEAA